MGFIVSILFFAIQVNLFFLFGRSLEQAWGTFRFNMYFISGWFLNIVAAFILYGTLHSVQYLSGFQYIYWSMFFAFATINPNMEFLFWFVIPIKVKWLAILDAVYLLYNVFQYVTTGIACIGRWDDISGRSVFQCCICDPCRDGELLNILFCQQGLSQDLAVGYQAAPAFQEAGQGCGTSERRSKTPLCSLRQNRA